MPTKKPSIRVLFEDTIEHDNFIDRAKENNRSAANEFRVSAGLPELAHGGKREKAGRKKGEKRR